jgi:hypothetical protein
MPAVEEVVTIVTRITDLKCIELRRRLDEFDEQEWQKELDESPRPFHGAGLTDDDIDEAVRRHGSGKPKPGRSCEMDQAGISCWNS